MWNPRLSQQPQVMNCWLKEPYVRLRTQSWRKPERHSFGIWVFQERLVRSAHSNMGRGDGSQAVSWLKAFFPPGLESRQR